LISITIGENQLPEVCFLKSKQGHDLKTPVTLYVPEAMPYDEKEWFYPSSKSSRKSLYSWTFKSRLAKLQVFSGESSVEVIRDFL
jgi:hypothetical protein